MHRGEGVRERSLKALEDRLQSKTLTLPVKTIKYHKTFMPQHLHQKYHLGYGLSSVQLPSPLSRFRDGSSTGNMEGNVYLQVSWLAFLPS